MIVVLYEPEIPPNTGNVARLCAAFDVELHLIEPLGFSIDNKHLKRAGLDYWPHVRLHIWHNWNHFMGHCIGPRLIMATTQGTQGLPDFIFEKDDALIFGPETRGLPADIMRLSPYQVRIPCRPMDLGGVRSLNLSTACGIFLYTALAHTHQLEPFS